VWGWDSAPLSPMVAKRCPDPLRNQTGDGDTGRHVLFIGGSGPGAGSQTSLYTFRPREECRRSDFATPPSPTSRASSVSTPPSLRGSQIAPQRSPRLDNLLRPLPRAARRLTLAFTDHGDEDEAGCCKAATLPGFVSQSALRFPASTSAGGMDWIRPPSSQEEERRPASDHQVHWFIDSFFSEAGSDCGIGAQEFQAQAKGQW
jgi:hypothetical protein